MEQHELIEYHVMQLYWKSLIRINSWILFDIRVKIEAYIWVSKVYYDSSHAGCLVVAHDLILSFDLLQQVLFFLQRFFVLIFRFVLSLCIR